MAEEYTSCEKKIQETNDYVYDSDTSIENLEDTDTDTEADIIQRSHAGPRNEGLCAYTRQLMQNNAKNRDNMLGYTMTSSSSSSSSASDNEDDIHMGNKNKVSEIDLALDKLVQEVSNLRKMLQTLPPQTESKKKKIPKIDFNREFISTWENNTVFQIQEVQPESLKNFKFNANVVKQRRYIPRAAKKQMKSENKAIVDPFLAISQNIIYNDHKTRIQRNISQLTNNEKTAPKKSLPNLDDSKKAKQNPIHKYVLLKLRKKQQAASAIYFGQPRIDMHARIL